ncbi:MAG: glycosyltransferase family 4 protein [Nitrososphaerota archaeon]
MKLLVCSQTPLLRFTQSFQGFNEVVDASKMVEGVDFVFSPGGVTRMVYPLLMHMIDRNIVEEAHWVSLNPSGPDKAIFKGLRLHYVRLVGEALKGYGVSKERLWRLLHGLQDEYPLSLLDIAWADDYAYYTQYNRVCSGKIMELDREVDFDLFYIHDFQQLPTGSMLSTMKPKVFRWHIPFDETLIPAEWTDFLSRYLNAYDIVIVSCKRYMETLLKRGYQGRVYHIYPYINEKEYGVPSRAELDAFRDKFGLSDERIISMVARLDPMKGHDRAIRAFARIANRVGDVKLLIVGNGSFSSSRQGLGLSKGEIWRDRLTSMVERLGLRGRVIFTGHVSQRELEAAYTLSDFTILPSIMEGFGLVVVESWLYRKPVIVSRTAGISELIEDGVNGFLVSPDDVEELAGRMMTLLADENLRRGMGETGYETSKLCSMERGFKEEIGILEELVG